VPASVPPSSPPSAPASTPASVARKHTPARQDSPEAHSEVRVQGSSRCFGVRLTPQPIAKSKKDTHESRRVISQTIAQLWVPDHARRCKRC
jgi:hypothetical protein